MHILLTDILTCPRCGPAFGLIVLADRMEDRQVIEGTLGCANCRNGYPVRGGAADLRLGGGAHPVGEPAAVDAERAFRLAALSGVADRQGAMLVAGAAPGALAEVARLLPNAQVVGLGTAPPERAPGGSWVVADAGLPFRDRSLLAVGVVGPGGPADLVELARVVAPGGRLVLDGAGPVEGDSLAAAGWTPLLEQEGVAVASRTAPG
jgi:uncharacterized protein YbaR (Trm112 family)